MAEDRIDSIIDTAAVSAEIKAVNTDLDALAARLKNYPTLSLGNAASLRDLTKANQEYQKSLISLDATTKNIEKTKKEAVATAKQVDAAQKQEVKNADTLSNYYKQLGLAIKDAQIKYYNLAGQLGRNHPLSQAALKDANDLREIQKQLAEDTGVYSHSVGNYSGALTNFALTLRGIRGPTKLFGEALGFSAQEADQFRLIIEHAAQALAVFFRSKEAKAAAEAKDAAATAASAAANGEATVAQTAYTVSTDASAAATDTFLVSTEASTVALEAEAAAAVTTSTAMKVLRGALIASGVGILIAGIALLIYQLVQVHRSLVEAYEAQKFLNDITREGNKAASEQVESLKLVYNATQDLNLSMAERVKAVKYLQETYPEAFKNFNTEEILLGKAKTAYDELTKSIIKNAVAVAAKAKLGEIENEKLDAFLDFTQKTNSLIDDIRKTENTKTDNEIAKENNLSTKKQIEQFKKNNKILAAARLKEVKQVSDDFIDAIKKLNEKEKTIIDFAGAENLVDAIIGKPKGGEASKQLTDLIKAQSMQFDIYKRYQQLKIEVLKDGLEGDHTYYTDKLKILDAYIAAEAELLIKEGDNQIKSAREEEARQKSNLEKDKAGKNPEQVARINENIAILEYNLSQKIQDINAATDVGLKKLGIERVKDYKKIMDDQAKIEQDFNKQEIDYEQYTQDQIDKINKKRRGIIEADEAAALAAKKKLYGQFQDEIVNLAETTEKTIFDLIEKSLQRQIEALEKKKDLIDQNAQSEINNINQLGLSEADRIKRTASIEKQAAFDKLQLEEKIKDAKLRQAKFQKAADITAIISGTALAIVNALKSAPPPANFALAAIVGAAGAIQLAAAIASPLPKFAKGTDNAPEGWAIVGEQGREMMKDKHGNVSLSPGVPTLTYLQGGEKITPAHLTQDILNASAMRSIANMDQTKAITAHDINTALIKDQLQELRWLNRKTTNVSVNMPVENSMWHIKHFKQ